MAKEFFKDLPNTTTPLTAARLNGLLDGEEAMGNLVVDSIRSKNMLNIFSMYGGYYTASEIATSNAVNITSKTENSISFTVGGTWLGVASDYIEVKPSTDYTVSLQSSRNVNQMFLGIYYYDSSKTFISVSTTLNVLSYTTTSPANAKYIKVLIENKDSTSATITYSNIQLEEGSTATNYMPYQELNYTNKGLIMASPDTSTYLTLGSTGENLLPLKKIYQLKNNFAIESDGVKCLKDGVIKISGQVHWQTIATQGVKWLEIYKNTYTDSNKIAQSPYFLSNRGSLFVSSYIYQVSANDIIKVNVSGASGDTIRQNTQYTHITIEYID